MSEEMMQRDIAELTRRVDNHDRVIYGNGVVGMKEKVAFMWESYLTTKRIAAGVILGLMLNMIVSLINLLR